MKSPNMQQGQEEKPASGWFRGCNSVRDPWILDDAMYSWGVNVVNRGGIVQTRPGYNLQLTLPPGNLQGFEVITISKQDQNGNTFQNGNQFIVFAVDGLIYAIAFPLIQPKSTGDIFNDWQPYRLPNLQFNKNAKRVIFCVAEKSVNTNSGNISLTTTYSVMLIQDGVGQAAYWDGEINLHSNEDAPDFGIPTGTWMAFSGNRIWIARGTSLVASDLLDPLSYTERLTGTGRGDFLLPDVITGLANTVGYNFQTVLIAFTSTETFTFLSSIADREQWSSTANFQTILYPSLGCIAGLSIVNHEGLVWWYSPGGLVSSNSATAAYLSSRIKYQDVEMGFATSEMYEDMSGICSCSFGSYLLVSIPSNDVFNSKTMVMDYSVADELISQEAPAWQGVWTGTRPIKWAVVVLNGSRQAFFASVDYEPLNGSHNHIWIAFQNDRTDSYNQLNTSNALETVHNPIYCSFESKLLGDGLDKKVFKYALIDLMEISGVVNFKASYRGIRGSYKEILNIKLIAITDAWQTTSQEIIQMLQSGIVLVPQRRRLRTEQAIPLNNEADESAESDDDETIDRCFSLYCQWCGRAAVEAIMLTMEPKEEKAFGQCTPDENTLNIVTQDGTSKKIPETNTDQTNNTAATLPPLNFTNQLYARPITPRSRDVYYSSIPPVDPPDPSGTCITCLECARDNYPPVVFDPTQNDLPVGGGPVIYFGNTAQSYTSTCPEGTVGDSVTITVPSNYFFATTLSGANVLAYNSAVEQANAKISCVGLQIPVVQSDSITVAPNGTINYQIQATNLPTSYAATGLPTGLSLNTSTGLISGTVPATITTYTIPISATNPAGTGNGTLTIHVQVPAGVAISFHNNTTSGATQIFEVSIDGGAYGPGAFGTTYNPTTQIKYRLTVATQTYLTGGGINSISATFTPTGSIVFQSGSTSTANGVVTRSTPKPDIIDLWNPIFGNGNVSFAFNNGTFSQSQSISGSVFSGTSNMGIIYGYAEVGTQYNITTDVVLETILNF